MNEYQHLEHTFEPIFQETSEILILGSFPSVKSRENNFYYGHPQNRFWKVLAYVCGCGIPKDIEEKKEMLRRNHIAIWDVIKECDIIGSSDSSIKNVKVNDINKILQMSQIKNIYANGTLASNLYNKYAKMMTGREIITLPSTSPANAAYTLVKLQEIWKIMKGAGE